MRFLDEKQIKFVIMGVPAGGFDNVLWQVAQEMELVASVYFKLIITDFWVKNLNDMGTFSTCLLFFHHKISKCKKN